ncbi:MAG: hydrogenase maturation nickel metallochaperone HypA [Bifidobacteriaceae bacterium]|nr:hydrogenase maturation nickel metallochaperone HypA [Bifidobacteriaceae bacterium]
MHELSLLTQVIPPVMAAVTARGATSCQAVGLVVGSLSGAVPEALQGAWPLATAGTVLEGARLEVEPVQAAIWCPGCQAEVAIDQFYALVCPACGTPSGQLTRGREFQVAWVDLDTT